MDGEEAPIDTKSGPVRDLSAPGVRPGRVVMQVLGPEGSLMMDVGREDIP